VSASQSSKSCSKARKNVIIGYDERKKGWKCIDPVSGKFVVSKCVVFVETSSYVSPQGVANNDLGGSDKVEHVLEVIITLPASFNAATLSGSFSSSLV